MIELGYFGIALGAAILENMRVKDALDHVLVEHAH